MKQTILLTGANGLVGNRLVELLTPHYSLFTPPAAELDIRDADAVVAYMERYNPSIVFHCAAHTDLNAAENERGDTTGLCWQINVEGTRNIVNAANVVGAQMLFLSTDYVFPGMKDRPGPYKETDQRETNPDTLSWYGYTKSICEQLVEQGGGAIVRISNPVKANNSLEKDKKLDYIHKIVSLYNANKLYPLFFDQYLSLTWIDPIADVGQKIIEKQLSGVFHVSSTNIFTPHELATFVLTQVTGHPVQIAKTSIQDVLGTSLTPQRYVQYSGLDVTQTSQQLGVTFLSWEEIISKVLVNW